MVKKNVISATLPNGLFFHAATSRIYIKCYNSNNKKGPGNVFSTAKLIG